MKHTKDSFVKNVFSQAIYIRTKKICFPVETIQSSFASRGGII